jgi:starch synthase
MRRSAMSRSFSWDLSAACYNALYRKALSLPL